MSAGLIRESEKALTFPPPPLTPTLVLSRSRARDTEEKAAALAAKEAEKAAKLSAKAAVKADKLAAEDDKKGHSLTKKVLAALRKKLKLSAKSKTGAAPTGGVITDVTRNQLNIAFGEEFVSQHAKVCSCQNCRIRLV